MAYRLIAALLALLLPRVVLAQSAPNWAYDYIPSVQDWPDTWAGKADVSSLAGKADIAQLNAEIARALATEARKLSSTASAAMLGSGTYAPARSYSGSISNSIAIVLGSNAVADASLNAALVVQKWTTGAASGSVANPAAYFSSSMSGTIAGYRTTAIMAQAVNQGGGNGTFVEGGRFQGQVSGASGQANGIVCNVGSDAGVLWDFLIGCEADVENMTSDAPPVINLSHYAIGFLATNAQNTASKIADVAFATNYYTAKPFRVGFEVLGGVSDAAFRSIGSTTYGLDLTNATISYAAVVIPNATAFMGRSSIGTDLNLFYTGGSQFILGTGTQGITLPAVNAPGTPGMGLFDIYMDNVDNKLKARGPTGTVTILASP